MISVVGRAIEHPSAYRDLTVGIDIRRGTLALLRFSWVGVAIAGVLAFVVLAGGVRLALASIPGVPVLPEIRPPPETSRVLDVNGRTLAFLHGEEDRRIAPLRAISTWFQRAVISIEDQEFYDHSGVSVSGTLRALGTNLTRGEISQGGSTITQQYIRNAVDEVGRERSIARKFREMALALKLESVMDKDEIFERYLNAVYFGRGAYGAEAAARAYFGIPARKVNVIQAAYLAGLIQAPELHGASLKAGVARRNQVLELMVGMGYLTVEQGRKAMAAKLAIEPLPKQSARGGYFVEYVRRLLKMPKKQGGFGLTDAQILGGGLTIHTTLDYDMQRAAEFAVRRVLDRKGDPEVGMVAMTTDGQIRAMIGGRNTWSLERSRGYNHATQIVEGGGRQVGSAFKPFTLAAWLQQRRSAHTVLSAPARITVPRCGSRSKPWRPANYGDQGFGSLSVIQATQKSVNTVYAQMVARVGPRNAMKMAKAAGVTSPLLPVCSITLGPFGVSPLEMARAYATFGARGLRPEVIAVTKIVDRTGTVIASRSVKTKRTISKRVADGVNAILRSVMTSGTGTPARIRRTSAGKTGTTEDRRDVWFVGHTPAPGLSAAVWIGYPPNSTGYIKRLGTLHGRPATGGYFAGRIWKFFMEEALDKVKPRGFASASLGKKPASKPKQQEAAYRSQNRPRSDDRKPKRPTRRMPPARTTRRSSTPASTSPAAKPQPPPEPGASSDAGAPAPA